MKQFALVSLSPIRVITLTFAMVSLLQFASAESFSLRKNDVIAVKFDKQISLKDSQQGDRFTTTVTDDQLVPAGSKLYGKIARLQQSNGKNPGSMDLVFEEIRLPDGKREPLRAAPIPLSDKYVSRDEAGHYRAKAAVRKDTAVGAGAIGGLVLGALLHKPFEGLFAGVLAGILVAETSGNEQNLVIKEGTKVGALIQSDAEIASDLPNGSTPRDSDSRVLDVSIGETALKFDSSAPALRIDGVVMVPIESAAKQLQLTFDHSGSFFFVENDNHSLRLSTDAESYRLDGKRGTLTHSLVRKNGVFYAPADILAAITGEQVSINGTKVEN